MAKLGFGSPLPRVKVLALNRMAARPGKPSRSKMTIKIRKRIKSRIRSKSRKKAVRS
jgi:hypothetical protein